MALKSLMYYVVLAPDETSPLLGSVLNVFWRGICVEDLLPGKFCQPPNPLTLTQATLVAPLTILIILLLPTILYVLVLSLCNAKKGMGVIDHAILFIFPIFTNLYFNYKAEVVKRTPKLSALEWRAQARSHSAPNISTAATEGSKRKRSCTSHLLQSHSRIYGVSKHLKHPVLACLGLFWPHSHFILSEIEPQLSTSDSTSNLIYIQFNIWSMSDLTSNLASDLTSDRISQILLSFCWFFSCPGSSIPDLGQSLTEWLPL